VHQVASKAVAKWNSDVFKRFNGERFSVAPCNNFFARRARGANGKNFATMVLKCEKPRHKMWSFEQSESLSSGRSTGPWGQPFQLASLMPEQTMGLKSLCRIIR
jgi:hypothetical protein